MTIGKGREKTGRRGKGWRRGETGGDEAGNGGVGGKAGRGEGEGRGGEISSPQSLLKVGACALDYAMSVYCSAVSALTGIKLHHVVKCLKESFAGDVKASVIHVSDVVVLDGRNSFNDIQYR